MLPGRRRTYAIVACSAALAAGVAGWRVIPSWRDGRVYRVGYGDDVPFQFRSADGLPTGVAVEIVKEAARRARIPLAWVEPRNAGIGAILSGETDLWVLLTHLPERQKQIFLTEPYMTTERCFVVVKGGKIRSQQDLAGARIAFRESWSGQERPPIASEASYPNADELYLQRWFPRAHLVPVAYRNSSELIQALQADQADAGLLNKNVVAALLLTGGDRTALDILPAPEAESRLALASSFAAQDAASRIRAQIQAMAEDGTVTRIAQRWGFFQSTSLDIIAHLAAIRRTSRWLAVGLVALALTTLSIGILMLRLRREHQEILVLSSKLINAQEEERTRVARELHDDLSQQLAAISVRLSGIPRQTGTLDRETRSVLDRTHQNIVDLSESMRRLSHELHPSLLEHSGLAAALRAYCEEFGSLTAVQPQLQVEGGLDDLPASINLCVFRVSQEALRNIAKHAGVREAQITVRRSGEVLTLRIQDRGRGFEAKRLPSQPGLGLISMKERIRLVHGVLDIKSQPNKGTTVMAIIPMPAPSPAAQPSASVASPAAE